MFKMIKKWLTGRQYLADPRKKLAADVNSPLFMQRSPARQERMLRQELHDYTQRLRRTEIERDQARKERDDEVKKRQKVDKSRRQAWEKWANTAKVALFVALTLVLFVITCAVSGNKENVLVNGDRQYSQSLVTQSGKPHLDWRRNFKSVVVANTGDNSWLTVERDGTYVVEYYVVDYNSEVCQADINLVVSAAWKADELGLATLAINLGGEDLALSQLTLSSSDDLSITDISVVHSSCIVAETDDSESIEQYLADHGMEERLDSQWAERLWHFVIKIETGAPKYATTYKTSSSIQEAIAIRLFFCMAIALVFTGLVSLGWEFKYKYSDIYADDDYDQIFYNAAVSEEEFVAKLEAYLQDYYADEDSDDQATVADATTGTDEKPTETQTET